MLDKKAIAALLLLIVAFPALWSYVERGAEPMVMKMSDFDGLYFAARCAIHGQDPYLPAVILREVHAERGRFPKNSLEAKDDLIGTTEDVYFPTMFLLAVPFAVLPWGIAQDIWTILTAIALALSAGLMADLCDEAPAALYLALAGFVLANSFFLFLGGNPAAVVVSSCLVATWCFLKERHVWLGILLLAVGLVVKPQDAGFVWLYFILAGGMLRRRALQTLAVVGVLAVCAAIWIAPISPHWIYELQQNFHLAWAHGSLCDPGPSGITARTPSEVMDLQAALSYLWDNPRFYNLVAYLIGYGLILVWAAAVLRKRRSLEPSILALATIAILTFLPAYHRFYDSRLLLLTLPACALLWMEGGARRWVALGLTSTGILVTSDIPVVFLVTHTKWLPSHPPTLAGKLVDMFLLQPAPLVLLAMGCFYLWAYLRYVPASEHKEVANAISDRSSPDR